MSRLIIMSNRVSKPKARSSEASQGGLAVALGSALARIGRNLVRLVGPGHRPLYRPDGHRAATTA